MVLGTDLLAIWLSGLDQGTTSCVGLVNDHSVSQSFVPDTTDSKSQRKDLAYRYNSHMIANASE